MKTDNELLAIAKEAERKAFGNIKGMLCVGKIYNALLKEREDRLAGKRPVINGLENNRGKLSASQ